ncbi:hypothetical protein C7435_2800 [Maricaulis maris]|uniref:Uncharacterized protein n=1 Tax=Maricaulis maris TaxID=74318 RepID=A0A495D2G1_9PROT|nr:hypothetical protein C7435_2800 [Maricaulis maris]
MWGFYWSRLFGIILLTINLLAFLSTSEWVVSGSVLNQAVDAWGQICRWGFTPIDAVVVPLGFEVTEQERLALTVMLLIFLPGAFVKNANGERSLSGMSIAIGFSLVGFAWMVFDDAIDPDNSVMPLLDPERQLVAMLSLLGLIVWITKLIYFDFEMSGKGYSVGRSTRMLLSIDGSYLRIFGSYVVNLIGALLILLGLGMAGLLTIAN